MKYEHIIEAKFISRPNRFVADVEINGEINTVHVKNTGRCKELLIPGARVYLEKAKNTLRKTKYSLIAVEKGNRLINIDSQAPNRALLSALSNGYFLPNMQKAPIKIISEIKFEHSRLDFCLEFEENKMYIEVKGVTLEKEGKVFFPDAPTERGIKHLKDLISAKEQGFKACVVFVVQMSDVISFEPNNETHPAFGDMLKKAERAGVDIFALDTIVKPDSMIIGNEVKVII